MRLILRKTKSRRHQNCLLLISHWSAPTSSNPFLFTASDKILQESIQFSSHSPWWLSMSETVILWRLHSFATFCRWLFCPYRELRAFLAEGLFCVIVPLNFCENAFRHSAVSIIRERFCGLAWMNFCCFISAVIPE